MHEIEFLIIVVILLINSHWSMQRGEHVIAVVIAFRFLPTAASVSYGRVLAFARLPHAIVAGQSEAAAMEERERGERL